MEAKVMKQLFSMKNSLDALSPEGKDKLGKVMVASGISVDEINDVNLFVMEEISPQRFSQLVENQAILSYIEAFRNIKKLMEMAKGYEEMGEINSEIAEEMRHLEDEVEENANEVDTKNTENQA
jgi:hypothetical protein